MSSRDPAPPPPPCRRGLASWWPWLALLSVVVGLRVGYVCELRSWPAFDRPAVDAGYNDAWARAIARGDEHFSEPYSPTPVDTAAYFRPPGYPFFLALVYRIFGENYLAPRIVQMLLGVASVALLAWFGRRWYGAAVGFVAMLLAGTYWGLIYFEGELLEPALLIFSDVVMLAALAEAGSAVSRGAAVAGNDGNRTRSASWWALLAGLSLGVHAVSRPNVLLFAPLAAAWLCVRALAGSEPLLQRLRARSGVWRLPATVLTLGVLVVVLPVTARNWRAGGEFVLISANGGVNLFIGNNDYATGLFVASLPGLGDFGTSSGYGKILAGLSRQAGRPFTYGGADRHFAEKAVSWIRAHPGKALALLWRRIVYLTSAWETGHNRSLHWERRNLPLLPWLPGSWAGLLALAAAGLALRGEGGGVPLRGDRRHVGLGSTSPVTLLITLFGGCYAASFLPFFVTGQYRMPLVVWLCLGAAWTLTRVFGELRHLHWRRALSAVVAAGAVYGLIAVNWYDFQPNLGKWHFDNASAWKARGEPARAEAGYRRAIAAGGQTGEAWYNLANLIRERGELDQAALAYRSALTAGIREKIKVYSNLGLCLLQGGRVEESLAVFAEAVQAGLTDAVLLSNYGTALGEAGRADEARAACERALGLDPGLASAHLQLGQLLRQAGDRAGADPHFDEAVRLQPGLLPLVESARR